MGLCQLGSEAEGRTDVRCLLGSERCVVAIHLLSAKASHLVVVPIPSLLHLASLNTIRIGPFLPLLDESLDASSVRRVEGPLGADFLASPLASIALGAQRENLTLLSLLRVELSKLVELLARVEEQVPPG